MNRYLDGIMGLVVGDSLGVPVEFRSRKELHDNPVTDMREYGTHMQPKGTWSDDSSMALANLASLHKGYDLNDIAEQFSKWNKEEAYNPLGEVFDIGMTCSEAISNYDKTKNPKTCGLTEENSNGNGSLMRILPMCIYMAEKGKRVCTSEDESIQVIHDVSAITHAHLRSKMACGLYYYCVKAIINHRNDYSLIECLKKGFDEGFSYYRHDFENFSEMNHYKRLMDLDELKNTVEDDIASSGYVVASLEASIWCLINTDTYKECVIKAVNLGDDTDTVAAIAGGLAGLFYGYDSIPEEWKNDIIQRKWIEELCDFSY